MAKVKLPVGLKYTVPGQTTPVPVVPTPSKRSTKSSKAAPNGSIKLPVGLKFTVPGKNIKFPGSFPLQAPKTTTAVPPNPDLANAIQGAAANEFYGQHAPHSNDPLAIQSGDQLAEDDMGHGSVYTGTGSEAMKVRAVQQVLVKNGYHITVDGIEGPETRSAIQAMQDGIGAAKWNTTGASGGTGAQGTGSTSGASTGTGGSVGTSTTTKAAPDSSAGVGTGTTTNGGLTLSQLMSAMGKNPNAIDASKFLVNAKTVGAAQAGEEYNPQITAANQAIADATTQNKTNMADLTKWFGDASGLAASGAKTANQVAQQGVAEQNTANQGVLQSFGGNAGVGGQNMANGAVDNSNDLIQQQQTNAEFNNMMQGVVGSMGASAKASQLNSDNTNISDMKSQLASLIAAKALGVTNDQNTMNQQNLSTLVNVGNANNAGQAANMNALDTALMLPGALTQQTLKNLGIAVNTAHVKAVTSSIPIENALKKADIAHTNELTSTGWTNTQLRAVMDKIDAAKSNAEIKQILLKSHIDQGTYNAKAVNYISGLVKAANPSSPQAAAALVKTYARGMGVGAVPTPYEYASIIAPALQASGITGFTPAMFGMGAPAAPALPNTVAGAGVVPIGAGSGVVGG